MVIHNVYCFLKKHRLRIKKSPKSHYQEITNQRRSDIFGTHLSVCLSIYRSIYLSIYKIREGREIEIKGIAHLYLDGCNFIKSD